MKDLILLGSTGSIGNAVLKVVKKNNSNFKIKLLTTNKNIRKIYKQAVYFNVKKVRSSRPRIFPYGYKERKMAFAPGGLIAKRFAYKRKSIVQVGNWLFVHGGITPML